MRQSVLGHEAHVVRARQHYQTGAALHQAADDEWAAVCYFYAAYHYVKAALLADPIFEDPSRCGAKDPDLNVEDRYTDRHQVRGARGQGRGWGINDLVLLLYRDIVGDYDRLHQASISVRYRAGLPAGALDALHQQIENITNAFDDGLIEAE